MVEIDKTVRSTADSMTELQSVTDRLDETAGSLGEMVDEFKSSKTTSRKAEYRHAGKMAA